ncbi:MAG: lysyl oxidase family protein, partial [Chloroflexota bacterium]
VPTSAPETHQIPITNSLPDGAALVDALRAGGYVIYFRHAASDYPQSDAETHILRDCSRQGNLNKQGLAEARAIGESFLSLNIPVGQVWTSQYCRARDTALLTFGKAETTEALTAFPEDLREQRITDLQEMLSTPPEPGTNTILISHALNLTNTAEITLSEGEAAIFEPLGEDGFNLIARILPGGWIQLERLVVVTLQVGPASDPDLILPDLETLVPTRVGLRVHSITGEKLLRFTNLIVNNGPGPMELWGYSNPSLDTTIVAQNIFRVDDSIKSVPVGEFIFHPEHDHWHMADFARYEIWSVNAEGGLDSIVAVSDKLSYCLRDDESAGLPDTPRFQMYTGCNQKRQGISPGWTDVYEYYLEGQNVDITHLPDGLYALRSIANPSRRLWESNYANNAVLIYFEILDDRLTVVDVADVILQSQSEDK